MENGTKTRIPNVVSIAGVDPSGGAGVLADVKAISACGAYAGGVVTALTAQNTQAVTGVLPVDCAFVRAQLDTLFDDVEVDAVKIGMLGTRELIETVGAVLTERAPKWIVLDPVMVAKSGDRLLEAEAVSALIEVLLPQADVLTPNLPEAQVLLGRDEPIETREEMEAVGRALLLYMKPGAAVLMKGGHLASDEAPDLLVTEDEVFVYEAPRIHTKNTHGTGCTFSSALAAYLPQSPRVDVAVGRAKDYLTKAIEAADDLSVGSGHGPTDHFWMLREMA